MTSPAPVQRSRTRRFEKSPPETSQPVSNFVQEQIQINLGQMNAKEEVPKTFVSGCTQTEAIKTTEKEIATSEPNLKRGRNFGQISKGPESDTLFKGLAINMEALRSASPEVNKRLSYFDTSEVGEHHVVNQGMITKGEPFSQENPILR